MPKEFSLFEYGSGVSLLNRKVKNIVAIKTLVASTGMTITHDDNTVTFASSGGGTSFTDSASLQALLSDPNGTGTAVFGTSPTLTTPILGVAAATSINKVALTAPATSATLTLANGSTLVTSGAFSTTLTATATTVATLPAGTSTLLGTTSQITTSFANAASNSVINLTGALFTGGSGTTTFPMLRFEPSTATAKTGWNTNGTFLGINAAAGFNGRFLDFGVDNATSVFTLSSAGALSTGSVTTTAGNVTTASGLFFQVNGRSKYGSTADGVAMVLNSAGTATSTFSCNAPVANKTANYPLLLTEGRTVFTNSGSSGEVDFTWPAIAVGQSFTFYVQAAQILKIIAPASVTITLAATTGAAAGNTSSSTVGSSVTLTAISTTQIVATSIIGVWVTV